MRHNVQPATPSPSLFRLRVLARALHIFRVELHRAVRALELLELEINSLVELADAEAAGGAA